MGYQSSHELSVALCLFSLVLRRFRLRFRVNPSGFDCLPARVGKLFWDGCAAQGAQPKMKRLQKRQGRLALGAAFDVQRGIPAGDAGELAVYPGGDKGLHVPAGFYIVGVELVRHGISSIMISAQVAAPVGEVLQ